LNVRRTDTSSHPAYFVWTHKLDPADDQVVNSRLLVRRQKMHGSQRCYGELLELTVDDVWQIADAGNRELGKWHIVVGTRNNSGWINFVEERRHVFVMAVVLG